MLIGGSFILSHHLTLNMCLSQIVKLLSQHSLIFPLLMFFNCRNDQSEICICHRLLFPITSLRFQKSCQVPVQLNKSHVRVRLFGGPVKGLSVLHRSVCLWQTSALQGLIHAPLETHGTACFIKWLYYIIKAVCDQAATFGTAGFSFCFTGII